MVWLYVSKRMFQSPWCLDLGWNAFIPDVQRQQFRAGFQDLDAMKSWKISCSCSDEPWGDMTQVTIISTRPRFLSRRRDSELWLYASGQRLPSGGWGTMGEPATISLSDGLSSETSGPILNFRGLSEITKVMRIMAPVSRFLRNVQLKKNGHGVELTFGDFEATKLYLPWYVQQQEFAEEPCSCSVSQGSALPKGSLHKLPSLFDKAGLLSVYGRLQFSESPYDSQHQIIYTKSHIYASVKFCLVLYRWYVILTDPWSMLRWK